MAKPISAKKSRVGTRYEDDDGVPLERPTPLRCAVCQCDNYTHIEGCPLEHARVVKLPEPPPEPPRLRTLARSTLAAVLRKIASVIEPRDTL